MIADLLLSRLEKVRQTGEGRWIACCPAHDDRNPSLSITEKDNLVLINCLAGCPPTWVVESVGLDLSDLFPPRENYVHGSHKRRYFPAADVLECLSGEISYMHQCASDMRRGEKLNPEDYERLLICRERFETAKELIGR